MIILTIRIFRINNPEIWDYIMRQTTFDLDVLRSFAAGMAIGNFAKAAERLGRSTSAVSAQMKKLEEQAGTPIFRKAGRGLALTEAGETMLAYAHRLLELNDEAAVAVRGVELEGWVRLGLQEDFAEGLLPDVLGRFARAHPKVRIEARVARNTELLDRVGAGTLDLALAWNDGVSTLPHQPIAELPMRWIGATHLTTWAPGSGEPVPLASLEAPCIMRSAATKTLDAMGISWRLAFVSPSLAGLWAAAAAGLGITVRTATGLPSKVKPLVAEEAGLPALPNLGLSLFQAEAELGPAAQWLGGTLRQAAREFVAH